MVREKEMKKEMKKEYFSEEDVRDLKAKDGKDGDGGDDMYYAEPGRVEIFYVPDARRGGEFGNFLMGIVFVAGIAVLTLAFALAAEGRLDNVILVLMN